MILQDQKTWGERLWYMHVILMDGYFKRITHAFFGAHPILLLMAIPQMGMYRAIGGGYTTCRKLTTDL
jgi:hypothetical protein